MSGRVLLALFLVGTAGACEWVPPSVEGEGIPVARVEDRILSVEELVELIGPRRELPADVELVGTVADLWVDHLLLLRAGTRTEGFQDEELEPLLREQTEEQRISRLRASVIEADTALDDDELLALWQAESPGSRIRVRHILLRLPPNASEDVRDSVRARARELRSRILEGEEFATLARRHSDDPSSAREGGDLGSIERGQMIASLDETAFSLDPGETSEPVESPYGLHLLRVEERFDPEFEAEREAFARSVRQRRIARAESTYVARLLDEAESTVLPGAPEVVRALAARPHARLYGSAANRRLATYRQGEITVADVQADLRARNPGFRARVVGASDEEIEVLLEDLIRRTRLLEEAASQEFESSPERRDSLRTSIRERLEEVVRGLGASPGADDSPDLAELDALAMDRIRAILTGEIQVPRLGPLTARLRREIDAYTYEASFPEVVEGVEALRENTLP